MELSKRRGTEDVKASFEALYDRVAERLLVYLARRIRDPDAAAELWAECWAAAFESWPRCRASGTGRSRGLDVRGRAQPARRLLPHRSDPTASAREAQMGSAAARRG